MRQSELSSRFGFEIELLAPRGVTRADLAEAIARNHRGIVRRTYHRDTELSLVKGRPVFHNLTLAFQVLDAENNELCRMVDDVTIRSDLDPDAAESTHFHRILSDDPRLMRLAEEVTDPAASAGECLKPIAELFGVGVQTTASGRHSVSDRSGATVAMATMETGERDRVCEIVTRPLERRCRPQLEELLGPARELGFTVPAEAAVHVHLDAAAWRSAPKIGRLVRLFAEHRELVWQTMGTNEQCRRLGELPEELTQFVTEAGFEDAPWDYVESRLRSMPLSKHCDLNVLNLANRTQGKDTVEIRVLPGSIDEAEILSKLDLLDRLLDTLPLNTLPLNSMP